MKPPTWVLFFIGLLLVLGLWENYPKIGIPLGTVLAIGLALTWYSKGKPGLAG